MHQLIHDGGCTRVIASHLTREGILVIRGGQEEELPTIKLADLYGKVESNDVRLAGRLLALTFRDCVLLLQQRRQRRRS